MIETKKYEEYKDSGIEWVGMIPMGWQTRPLFAVVRANTESNKAGAESNLLSLSYGRIIRKDIAANDGLLPASFNTYQVIRQNDIVLRLTDLQNDKRSLRSAISPERGIITSAYLAVTPTGVLPNYLSYLLRAYDLQKVFYSMGGGLRQSMKYSDMKWLPVILPPESTQCAIVDFLDQETAQIDDLIIKQECLIELLAEKRQTIITHAVTRGLDPTASTKSSGIPWLGDVNDSWPLRPLKAAGHINLGKMIQPGPKSETDFEAPYLRAANVQPNGALALDDVKNMWFKDSELQSLDVRSGDVVVVEGGIGGFGRAAYINEDLPGFGYQNSINRIRPSELVDGRFLAYLLLAARHAGYIHAYCTGVSMPHLTAEKLAAIRVPLPDRVTQISISDHIDAKVAKLNALSDKASEVITILHERRSALISAAVTGKIDVREGAA